MTRRDWDFLSGVLKQCLKAGTIQKNAVYVIAAHFDTQYSNFNRDRFEAAVLGSKDDG